MKKKYLSFLAVLIFSACSQSSAPPTEDETLVSTDSWIYSASVDKMDDWVIRYASVYSMDRLPASEQALVALEIQEIASSPDVLFRVHGAQFNCNGGYDDADHINTDKSLCSVRIRFDNSKPIKFVARTWGDSNEMLSIVDGEEFMAEMEKTKSIKVELPLYGIGSQVLSFEVAGFDSKKLAAAKVAVVP